MTAGWYYSYYVYFDRTTECMIYSQFRELFAKWNSVETFAIHITQYMPWNTCHNANSESDC